METEKPFDIELYNGKKGDYKIVKSDNEGEIILKAEEAFGKRQGLEEKIRVARMRKLVKSPSEIIRES